MDNTKTNLSWTESLRAFTHPSVITLLFLGFSAGIPILLIFSSLSLWLGEAGIERKAVTFFSWAALGYSFKFIWAPLVDKLPLPVLTRKLGRRRAWMLVAQLFATLGIVLMASVDPAQGGSSLTFMALAAVLLGFSSATQDIVVDAYRIESAETRLQAMATSGYVAGYRIGMVVAGAGALYLADILGSSKEHYVYTAWQWTYLCMALAMLVGIVTTLVIREPVAANLKNGQKATLTTVYTSKDYARLVLVFMAAVLGFVGVFFLSGDLVSAISNALGNGVLTAFFLESLHFVLAVAVAGLIGWQLVKRGVANSVLAKETWVEPVADFFQRYGLKTALLLLALIGFYRISDVVLGVISNVFYQDLGFSKSEIATAVKTFGVIVSIVGSFLGGLLATRFEILRVLMLGAILSAATNLLFVWLAYTGHNLPVMYLAVTADNLAAGLASAAFVAFISSLTSVSFTAVQYAIFSSLMTLIPKVMGGYSGTIVDNIGYPGFFTFTTLIGLPVLVLVWLTGQHLLPEQTVEASKALTQ